MTIAKPTQKQIPQWKLFARSFLLLLCWVIVASGCATSDSGGKSGQMDSEIEDAGDDEMADSGDGVDPDLAEDELGAGGDAQTDAPRAASVEVMDLRYLSAQHGGTVVIRTTGKASYRVREAPELKQVVIEVANANLPDRLKRPYITREFNQSISAINAYQDPGASTARFVVQLRENERLVVEQRGGEIFIAPESEANGESIAVNSADGGSEGGGENSGSRSYGAGVRDGLPMTGATLDELNYSSLRFYGKPISIEVSETNVRDVISFIADVSGANLVVADEVKGNVTLKLKQVPWDHALLLVMKAKQLGYVRQGNVLRIAPLDILQQETDNARKVVDAQRAAEPLRVRVVPVSYGKVDTLATQVKEFLSTRGKVVADVRTSSLVVTDIVENVERVTNLIRALDIPPLQVQIEAKVIEAREGFTREIGVRWGSGGGSAGLGGDLSLTPTIGVGPASVANNGSTIGLSLGTLDVLGNLDAQLGMFELEDQAKVISAPRVVTVNNETATINQTTRLPTTTTTIANGVTQTTVNFQDVKLALEVTPQITADSDVIMAVNIKREFPGERLEGGSERPINSREAKTKVMVLNGQTAVIGGIYQSDASERDAGVPWLRKIPILGWLFRQHSRTTEKNELLLFLTPRILNSSEGTVKSEEI